MADSLEFLVELGSLVSYCLISWLACQSFWQDSSDCLRGSFCWIIVEKFSTLLTEIIAVYGGLSIFFLELDAGTLLRMDLRLGSDLLFLSFVCPETNFACYWHELIVYRAV